MEPTYDTTEEGHLKELTTTPETTKEEIINPLMLEAERDYLQKQREDLIHKFNHQLDSLDKRIELNAQRIQKCEDLEIETKLVTKDVFVNGVLITRGDNE